MASTTGTTHSTNHDTTQWHNQPLASTHSTTHDTTLLSLSSSLCLNPRHTNHQTHHRYLATQPPQTHNQPQPTLTHGLNQPQPPQTHHQPQSMASTNLNQQHNQPWHHRDPSSNPATHHHWKKPLRPIKQTSTCNRTHDCRTHDHRTLNR